MLQRSDHEVVRAPASERVQRSVLRYTLLVAWAFLLAVPSAYHASTRMHVRYTAEGKLWMEGAAWRGRSDATPGGAGAVESSAWIELLRSYEVLGPVVLDRQPSLQPPGRHAVPGPRDAARDLSQRLRVAADREGGVIRVALEGTDPQETARVLNAVMERTVDLAGRLKQARHDEMVTVLEGQLRSTRLDLEQAERDLEEFRVGTVGASSRRSSPLDEVHTTEARLRRRVLVSEALYDELRRRVETARVEAASWTPDLRVLAQASVPDRPNQDGRLPIAAVILLAGLALVVGGGLSGSSSTL